LVKKTVVYTDTRRHPTKTNTPIVLRSEEQMHIQSYNDKHEHPWCMLEGSSETSLTFLHQSYNIKRRLNADIN
jgi:hypothetical protein